MWGLPRVKHSPKHCHRDRSLAQPGRTNSNFPMIIPHGYIKLFIYFHIFKTSGRSECRGHRKYFYHSFMHSFQPVQSLSSRQQHLQDPIQSNNSTRLDTFCVANLLLLLLLLIASNFLVSQEGKEDVVTNLNGVDVQQTLRWWNEGKIDCVLWVEKGKYDCHGEKHLFRQ